MAVGRIDSHGRQAIRKKPGRTEYQRGIVSQQVHGSLQVAITGSRGSGILRSMSLANGLVVLLHAQGNVEAGGQVDVRPFDRLVKQPAAGPTLRHCRPDRTDELRQCKQGVTGCIYDGRTP